ncbi:MAG TPA: dienelactone hydrolase family protein [Gaiellaceae bacterium]|nr:dienelactone hydrolase family protein [Gaiellaceae bacterium]
MSAASRVVLLALAAGLLAACGGSHQHAAQPPSGPPRLTFDYRRSAPLGFVDRGVVARVGQVTVNDVGFLSSGVRVDGYLVQPAGSQRRPGVVLVHGTGGDRRQLVGTAVALAQRGAVALTITAPSSAHPPAQATSVPKLLAESRTVAERDVVAVRRAADVLASRPNVNADRLGYLGWSAGAKLGIFVAASDVRFKALALLSAGADKVSAFAAAAPPRLRPLVKRQLTSIDPIRYVAFARPGTLLLEDGQRDMIIPHGALMNVVRAAPPHTVVRWYPLGHELDSGAFTDAATWLALKLR